jgi:Fe-S cluster assembly protein SufD
MSSLLVPGIERSDGFRFLNLSDVPWRQNLERAKGQQASVAIPACFANDPFAELASLQGKVFLHEVTQGEKLQHHFECTDYLQKNHDSEIEVRVDWIKVAPHARSEWIFYTSNSVRPVFHRIYVVLEKDAEIKLTLIQSGNLKSQIRAHVEHQGSGSKSKVHGLTLGKNQERQDLWIDGVHVVPRTEGSVTAWCAVKDQAHSIFNGTMTITKDAPFTEAHQKNKNLILSKSASVDAFPKLFIAHDEVKASHGSSVSTLEPDQLIYLQSRGIDRAAAEVMLTQGFIHQAIDWIEDESTRTRLEGLGAWA